MTMPERNEGVRDRDEQFATEPDQPRPEHTAPGRPQPEQMQPEQMQPEQMRSEQMRSEQMQPEQMRSEQMQPEQMQPEQMRSEQMRSDPREQQAGAADDGRRERLVPEDRAASYGSRWNAVKGSFVDDPRQAVTQADELVGELLEELETLFREQRRSIEQGLDGDETSTEDLRLALRRYRSFFDRLLAV